MFSRVWLIKTIERAIRAYAGAVATLLVGGATVVNIGTLQALLSAAVGPAVSVLFSVAGSQVGDPNSPSLLDPAGKLLGGLTGGLAGCDNTDAPDA